MAKVAISVSMDAEFAASLKAEAEQDGVKFSPLVCRYIEAGRNLRKTLFVNTERLNPDDRSVSSDSGQIPDQTPKEAVYSCLTDKPQTLDEIASQANLPVGQVGDIIDNLANSGEPVMLKVIDGSWYCWEDRNE